MPTRQPGELTDRTVLNVFGPTGNKGRYLLDNLKVGEGLGVNVQGEDCVTDNCVSVSRDQR